VSAKILCDDALSQTDDARVEVDVVELGSKQTDRLIVMDVALDGFLGVIGFLADRGDKKVFEMQVTWLERTTT
jgi:hypothetical protein